ncbi:superoxide dismutase [Nakamurella endophytica]|uniref:Superoxide dismutase n=1 Tax=Nakamurella endophytica TaxID=1748367 RepID=A0A917SN20_9ACTN|nr:superoxide dismutase [Nakamurella endophytica]GGL87815.1 superoxide dismutase [Nakamurella endophytica]
MAPYTLPDLPYDFGALEPHISGQITELHYTKHHQTYVTTANEALEQLAEAREKESFGTLPGLEKKLAFNLGGHVNHSIWWPSLSPNGGDRPDGELAAAIDEFFGSFDAFQKQFTANATSVMGSGWSVLAWDSLGQRLNIFQLYDQQGNIPAAQIPVLMVDVWEHAFYLQYKNVKADYVKAWWNVVNWADAQARFAAAKANTAGLVIL